jgi:rubrerythrin
METRSVAREIGMMRDHQHRENSSELAFEDKLKRLLAHWIGHNDDHAASYRKWAREAREHGFQKAARLIGEAAEATQAINRIFSEASKQVSRGAAESPTDLLEKAQGSGQGIEIKDLQ